MIVNHRQVVLSCGWIACLTLAACNAPAADSADWPCFRGPTGQGTSSERGLPVEWSGQDNIAWKIELPGAGTSTPIVVGDRIYLTCYSGFNVPGASSSNMQNLKRHLVCLDRGTGQIHWTKDIAAKLPEQDNIRDEHGYASNTLAADGQRLYAFFGKTGAMAFDFEGKKLWEADVGDGLHGWGTASSPVLHGDLVFINASVESESLVALDKASGKEKWRAEGIKESWNTPILVEAGGRT
ncbi:MAG: PQQ-binding-like beta-propeller repeat protein, partial [Pirellulales bacterium]